MLDTVENLRADRRSYLVTYRHAMCLTNTYLFHSNFLFPLSIALRVKFTVGITVGRSRSLVSNKTPSFMTDPIRSPRTRTLKTCRKMRGIGCVIHALAHTRARGSRNLADVFFCMSVCQQVFGGPWEISFKPK